MSDNNANNGFLVDNRDTLEALCAQLSKTPWLALDTEFERVNTFYPIPGLVQLGFNGEFRLVQYNFFKLNRVLELRPPLAWTCP